MMRVVAERRNQTEAEEGTQGPHGTLGAKAGNGRTEMRFAGSYSNIRAMRSTPAGSNVGNT